MALGPKSGAGARTSEVIRRLEGLRKDKTVTLSFRMDPHDKERLTAIAAREHLGSAAALVKKLVLDGLDRLARARQGG